MKVTDKNQSVIPPLKSLIKFLNLMKLSTYFQCSIKKYLFLVLFSISTINFVFAQSPGGVSSSLMLWLKANAGTSTTSNNAAISQWSDQSGNNRHATQSTASQQAIYKNNYSDNMNFNSVVDFTASAYNSFLLPTSVTLLSPSLSV